MKLGGDQLNNKVLMETGGPKKQNIGTASMMNVIP